MTDDVALAWWASLNHGGLLLTPAAILEFFGEEPSTLSEYWCDRLRRDIGRARDSRDESGLAPFLDAVFQDLLEFPSSQWQKASAVDARRFSHDAVTGETVKPQRVWLGGRGEVLPVFVDRDSQRLGVGRGRRHLSRVIEWLRLANLKVAVLTNGNQLRLIHAGADYDAFCEWDTALWFEEGRLGAQVAALRRLLGVSALTTPPGKEQPPLVDAILASRRGQGELSAMLGERVRQSVELIIQASSSSLEPLVSNEARPVAPNDIYVAATRLVMRLVVILFAEARELLPRSNPYYHGSYGLQGLQEELERAAGGRAQRLRERYSAWPRLLSLFRLMFEGSGHEELIIPQYGGGLFQHGRRESADGVSRALASLEEASNTLSDDVVYQVITLLTRTRTRVRQGRGSTWVDAPVDFSDLSSEYIGILYEGLLDFELRRAPATDSIVFLALGEEPSLPLSQLEAMNDGQIRALMAQLKAKKSREGAEDEETDEENPAAEEAEGAMDEPLDEDDPPLQDASFGDADVEDEERPPGITLLVGTDDEPRVEAQRRVLEWARQAAGLLGRKKPKDRRLDQHDIDAAAKALIRRLVMPGDWYLVRWGGTRKGAGTFYTRPQLAGPIARRALQPLAYVSTRPDATEAAAVQHDTIHWVPKAPKEILALRVVDPAMGSGSFLVSALRTLTAALYESLHCHGCISARGDGSVVRLADGATTTSATEELLPFRPEHEDFEWALQARLKRHIVERCLYGIDIDPVAVELARLALWVETMDRSLPFEFLDHKLKVGNALVGCWFDQLQDYPLAAWEREGGDAKHEKAVHHQKGKWSKAVKSVRDTVVRPQLAAQLRARKQPGFAFGRDRKAASHLHDDAISVLNEMNAVPMHDAVERARIWTTKVQDNVGLTALRHSLDAWCACWFWPGDQVAMAPTPDTLHALTPETSSIVREVAQREHFFHWELEFPDVFSGPNGGFDAVIGNPPWDTIQPMSKEFFSNIDPLYRVYGNQAAARAQVEMFRRDPGIEAEWVRYQAHFKALTNWTRFCSAPFGDHVVDAEGNVGTLPLVRGRESDALHEIWREIRTTRTGYAPSEHPFSLQGRGKSYTYRLFLELALRVLRREGRYGLVLPSGVYSDTGATDLRRHLTQKGTLECLFGFENRDQAFSVASSVKYACILGSVGNCTETTQVRFMLSALNSWEDACVESFDYDNKLLQRLSPQLFSFVELNSKADVALMGRILEKSEPLGSPRSGWDVRIRQGDFNMTTHSRLFVAEERLRAQGAKALRLGAWVVGSSTKEPEIFLPLYQGRMLWHFDASCLSFDVAHGWSKHDDFPKVVRSQHYISHRHFADKRKVVQSPRLLFRYVTKAVNERTFACALCPPLPCGHTVGVIECDNEEDRLVLCAVMNSLVFDWITRIRFSGGMGVGAIDASKLVEYPTIPKDSLSQSVFSWLAGAARVLSALWNDDPCAAKLTANSRLAVRVAVEAVVAHLFGLRPEDLRYVVRDCDHPLVRSMDRAFTRTLDQRGLWRVDKERPPELRLTVLALVAFIELSTDGLPNFLEKCRDGWTIPEELRLSDFGIGHDNLCQVHQPVASALGPRELPWQHAGTAPDAWGQVASDVRTIEQASQANGGVKPQPPTANQALSVKGGGDSVRRGSAMDHQQHALFGNDELPSRPRRGR